MIILKDEESGSSQPWVKSACLKDWLVGTLYVYKGSFFPQTIRDSNVLSDSLISSVAEDCVAKFTSLVRARD